MTKRFFEVLSLIFHYYDKDKDGAWKTSELNEFYVAVNGENVDDTTINFIRGHFTTTSHGHLTLEGFLELYLSQTAGSAEETWKDLSKLGFDSNLKEVDNRYAHLLNKP
jgi:Ca2+-binding EF-hand superfamily protein